MLIFRKAEDLWCEANLDIIIYASRPDGGPVHTFVSPGLTRDDQTKDLILQMQSVAKDISQYRRDVLGDKISQRAAEVAAELAAEAARSPTRSAQSTPRRARVAGTSAPTTPGAPVPVVTILPATIHGFLEVNNVPAARYRFVEAAYVAHNGDLGELVKKLEFAVPKPLVLPLAMGIDNDRESRL